MSSRPDFPIDGEDPQHYGLESALTYIWDVNTLAWIKNTGSGGGGGGAVTIADGADVAEGTTTDVAWTSGAGTVIALLKTIAGAGGPTSAVTLADGADTVEGTLADAAVVTDAAGTVSGKLRGLVKWAFERMPASLGQKAMAASFPVVIASDQSAVPISGSVTTGGLTDAQLRASAVPVSGTFFQATQPVSAAALPLPAGAATSALQTQPGVDIGDVTVNNGAAGAAVNIQDGGNTITVDGTVAVTNAGLTNLDVALSTRLAEATFTTRINTQGQKAMAASTPVVIASDQSAVPVSGSVTVSGTIAATQSGTWTVQPGNTPNTTAWLVSTKTDLTPSAPAAASVGVASAQAVAANAARKGLALVNVSNNRISLGFGSAAVLDSGVTLYPGGSFEMDEFFYDLGAVNAIASAASSPLAIQEIA